MRSIAEYSPEEFKEKILTDLIVKRSDSVILMCAILIASIGLNMNSIPVIIGAMLISPLMSPILGIGFGLSILDFTIFKKGAKLLLIEVIVSLVVATTYFFLSPISYASNEIIARTSPTIWDVIIATAGGVAGIIGARKKESTNIVPGVAIATALMPPVCTIGYSIASKNFSYFIGASYLFIINCAFIIIATFISIRLMKFPLRTASVRNSKFVNRALIIIALLIVVPSIASAASLVQESVTKSAINQLIENQFKDYVILDQTYNKANNSLTLTISGNYLTKAELEQIKSDLPSYGLDNVALTIDQVPDMSRLEGKEFANHLDQYIKNRVDTLNEKDVEKMKDTLQ